MVVVRRLRQGGEIGGLLQVQFVHRLAEILQRGGSEAVGALAGRRRAEEDLVQIELEDAVLRERRLHAQRGQGLADLALDRLLVGEEEVLGDLLGDGRGALLAAGAEIGQRGAHDALGIDAAMLVEVLVLGRQEGGGDELRHRLDRDVEAFLAGVFGEQAAVGRHARASSPAARNRRAPRDPADPANIASRNRRPPRPRSGMRSRRG